VAIQVWRQLRARGLGYWIRVLVLAVLGAQIGHWVGEHGFWIHVRYQLHQRLAELGPRPLEPRWTTIVAIGDEEYWRGELASRAPLKRDYLAKLLDVIDRANPKLIALDVDLRSPDPGRPLIHKEYRAETTQLVDTVRRIAQKRPMILAKTIGQKGDGQYVLEADLYDDRLQCRGLSDSTAAGPYCGYIALPRDARLLPPRLALEGSRFIDSFALAIANAANPQVIRRNQQLGLGYGSFIPRSKFLAHGLVLSADSVLKGSEDVRGKLAHRAVLVGGEWSGRAYGKGARVDMHASPVGLISGVLLHANYAEALLDDRLYVPTAEWLPTGVEFLLVLLAAGVFALKTPALLKALFTAAACLLLLVFGYILFQNFGRFFDGFVPLVFIAAHAVVDQLLEWRSEALSWRSQHAKGAV
jgi:CHASE2 domain-containing sensor protein